MMILNLALLFVFGLASIKLSFINRQDLPHGASEFAGWLLDLVNCGRHGETVSFYDSERKTYTRDVPTVMIIKSVRSNRPQSIFLSVPSSVNRNEGPSKTFRKRSQNFRKGERSATVLTTSDCGTKRSLYLGIQCGKSQVIIRATTTKNSTICCRRFMLCLKMKVHRNSGPNPKIYMRGWKWIGASINIEYLNFAPVFVVKTCSMRY